MRVAIGGTGAVARLHARALAAIEGVELVAVADPMEASRDSFGEEFGVVRRYAGIEQLLAVEDADVVQLCSPPSVHFSQALAAFAHGAHVVVEKPPAVTAAEFDGMRRAAVAAGR
jgi:predicted dehydrogenase